ncbi:inactive tyrosine-protein kinase PRAG1 [Podarcis raffonei]|uniref:inactive tyrosine-protein kinase PRAG1 n=1 Tax=Podarcis raffonei TaxID=65483 RepID=UPI0023294D5D|nr:inactive tyrosine-protein kinase PRAG1 [Podarcis raffonei]XP_053226539.1 inactive tyrosine-protein kinase PRAG1 [Podarcis raffonei]XP_053226540.1 inactive tyrosine-protein kinase PRAG1 [Podarcis raffonei]
MQRAVQVKRVGLKMSACSDFVEHIWKPGSCKNCFCPRHFHQLQAPPLDLGGSCGLLQDLNGTRAKAEPTALEDDGVVSLPYSKPTIAVKPTMINSDVADVWADGNLSADIPQVNKRMPPRNLALMKSGEEQRVCIDKFSNNIIRKPVIQNTPSDRTLHSPPGAPLADPLSLESSAERNVAFSNAAFLNDMGARENGNEVASKEKLSLPYLGLCHNSSFLSDRCVGSAVDSVGYSPVHQREEASLSERAGMFNSSDLESEGGEYCSITDYCKEAPAHQVFDNTKTKEVWHEKPISKLQAPEAVTNARTESVEVSFSEGESRTLNSDFQRGEKHPPHSYVYNHLCSETDTLVFPSDTGRGPCGSPKGNYCCPSVRESDQTVGRRIENASNSAEQQLSCEVASQNEPIYAESTKRKKTQLNNANIHARCDALAYSPCKDKQDGLWRGKALNLDCEREFQESVTQVPATITIVAAHTEDDNRTIFLSSPDSAVGVQWPSPSPTSNSEVRKTSPFFEYREMPQASSEMSPVENDPGLPSQTTSRNGIEETPAIPPKLSKGSPPRGEGPFTQSVSSFVAETCDGDGHRGLDIPKNGADSTIFEPASSICPHTNKISPEESNKGPATLSSERRQKYYNLSWSRQCRIEEEDEEEQGFLKSTPETETENGASSPSSISNCHQGGKHSVQENKIGGMSKSASFAFEFPKDKNGMEEFTPPPPPPKKQSRHFLKMNRSNSDLEKLSSDSTENLSPAFQGIHVTFTAGSTDSLNLDTNAFGNGGQSCKTSLRSPTRTGKPTFPSTHFPACPSKDRPQCKPLQPPPLPQKKTVSRAVSSPDGFYWGPASPARASGPASPKLNFSQSESNVCIREESPFGSTLGVNRQTFSSSESLEKAFRGSHSPYPCSAKNGGACCSQSKNLPPRSSSQNSMSTTVSSGSSFQLHNLLSNIDNKEGVYAKLGGLYAESLRRLVSKCEDCFMRDQKSKLHFSENNWSLFKLTCNKPCCDSGDAIYYCATCSKDPSSTYAVKICKTQDTKAATSCCSPSVPVHFNIQQDCGHFVATVPSSMLKNASADGQGPSRATTEQDCVVVITHEVPHQTAADFVRGSGPFHKAKPELYERRVCFLLLQLCNGLEHLKEYSIIHRDLCLENLLLVHCRPPPSCNKSREDKHLPRLIISNFLKAKQKPGAAESKAKKNQARLAPEIVSASQYKKFDEFQTGILIYELLHQPNPFEVKAHLREQEYSQEDLPPLPHLSIYSRGLQQLAHLLLEADPIKRIRIVEAKQILQCLLWGPRKDLTDQALNHEEALHNWIDMKRALLMMKFAERAVDAERSVELEDWLCCQYLAAADPPSLCKSLKHLQLL